LVVGHFHFHHFYGSPFCMVRYIDGNYTLYTLYS
jgi:hypothetical protein